MVAVGIRIRHLLFIRAVPLTNIASHSPARAQVLEYQKAEMSFNTAIEGEASGMWVAMEELLQCGNV